MNQSVLIVIAVAVVAVIVAALLISRRRRSEHLKSHFGPEYERALQENEIRRVGEGSE